MLRRVNPGGETSAAPVIKMSEAGFPAPFPSGLEYGAPARGTWNIVHTGMLIPEAHEIFVCASSCLRGVVLTAAEMGLGNRFSTVTVKENDLLDGDAETRIIEGVTDILDRLGRLPPAVLVYTSCVHHFLGCDLELCYAELRRRFPTVSFTDCYMNPIMRKSGLTPDQLMRRQLYSLLEPLPQDARAVNVIGSNFATHDSSELCRLIKNAGCQLRELPRTTRYSDYLDMARAALNITYLPAARAAGEALSTRLGQRHLHLPMSFMPQRIEHCLGRLAEQLGVDYSPEDDRAAAMEALDRARAVIGDLPVAIDYTAVPAPLSLARLLLEHGFCVTRIYADSFTTDEREEYDLLRQQAPDLELWPTVHPAMRVARRTAAEPLLAIGQKAAYFTGSKHFVNIVEGAGLYGFDGIRRMAELMLDAARQSRDPAEHIQQKGWGCSCCL